ncbi:hypothetical protein ABZ656_31460 [Streptomyces sp. NPDC007095]|uniref:hypothetical protein n=1 Tax=Streptomyces sp. NPDC007095 TaxID=3154482 RepID=UPI00340D9789
MNVTSAVACAASLWVATDSGAVDAGRAAGQQVFAGEDGAAQPVGKGTDLSGGGVVAHQFQHQEGQERAVHDESGIPLDVPGVRRVVVDAVGVRGERAEPEQQGRVGVQGTVPVAVRPGCRRGVERRPGVGSRGAAGTVDEVLFLDETGTAALAEFVALGHEEELAAPAPFGGHGPQAADALGALAEAQWLLDRAPPSGDHPLPVGNRREEVPVPGVAVGS